MSSSSFYFLLKGKHKHWSKVLDKNRAVTIVHWECIENVKAKKKYHNCKTPIQDVLELNLQLNPSRKDQTLLAWSKNVFRKSSLNTWPGCSSSLKFLLFCSFHMHRNKHREAIVFILVPCQTKRSDLMVFGNTHWKQKQSQNKIPMLSGFDMMD